MLNDIINLLNNNYIFISFQGIATLPLIVFYLSFRSCHHTHRFQSLISLRLPVFTREERSTHTT